MQVVTVRSKDLLLPPATAAGCMAAWLAGWTGWLFVGFSMLQRVANSAAPFKMQANSYSCTTY